MDEKKVKEAIEVIKANYPTSGYYMLRESLDIAIEALEKQLPKKVVDKSLVKDDGIAVGYVGKCPCCNEIIEYTTNVCDCGQRLDWSEVEA